MTRPRFQPALVVGEAELVWHAGPQETYRLMWSRLAEVWVRTTALGPWVEDLHFVLRPAEGPVVVVPHEAADDAFIARLRALPGFDDDQLRRSMRSTTDAVFPCWLTTAPPSRSRS